MDYYKLEPYRIPTPYPTNMEPIHVVLALPVVALVVWVVYKKTKA